MRKVIIVAALLAVLGVPDAARAEETTQQFLEYLKDHKPSNLSKAEVIQNWLSSVQQGFMWANTKLANQNRKRLYCAPGKMTMTSEQTVQVLKDYVEAKPWALQFHPGVALLLAFEYAFPCKK